MGVLIQVRLVVFFAVTAFCCGVRVSAAVEEGGDNEAILPRHWSYLSGQRSSWLGFGFASNGDIDRDGFLDLVVGVPRLAENGIRSGGFGVFQGVTNGLGDGPAALVRGMWKDVRFGDSMCGILDLNNDGFGDLLVAIPPSVYPDSDDAAILWYEGSASGLNSSRAKKIALPTPHHPRELRLAKAGDINGDGFQDIIVGVAFASFLSNATPVAWPLFGSSTGLVWQSTRAITNFGDVFGSAGDVNGDGFDDVIVGFPLFTENGTNWGKASLYLGSRAGLSDTAAWTVTDADTYERVGAGVAGIGDVNNDGYADIAVGATGRNPKRSGLGRVFVFLGSPQGLSKSPSCTTIAEHSGSLLGHSIAGPGDVNGDGFDDLILSAQFESVSHTHEGRVFLYFGTANGLESEPRLIIDGGLESAQFGFALAGAGDVDRDGLSDFLIGSPYYGNSPIQFGRIDLLYGSREAYHKPVHLVAQGGKLVRASKKAVVKLDKPMTPADNPAALLPTPAQISRTNFPWLVLLGSALVVSCVCIFAIWKQRSVALFRERERIARDLHDEVGVHLTTLAMMGNEAAKTSASSDSTRIQDVSHTAREIARAFEQAVWTVRPSSETLEHLVSFLGAQAPKFFAGSSTRCFVDLPVVVPERKLPENVIRNLLPAVKEVLNNAAKHARASEVWLRIRVEGGTMTIIVEDDGCGMDASHTAATRNSGFTSTAQGLLNIKQRIAGLGGRFDIQARECGGTKVVMQIAI